MEETDSELSELAMMGWINATLAFDGLLAAGPEFDRDKVTAATNSLDRLDGWGVIEPIDWTTAHTPFTDDTRPEDAGDECAAVVKVVDGEFETVRRRTPRGCASRRARTGPNPRTRTSADPRRARSRCCWRHRSSRMSSERSSKGRPRAPSTR